MNEINTTIVVATLLRPSLYTTMSYIRQYTNAEVIPYYDPKVNEYVVRNIVADNVTTPYISFIDDDAYPNPDWYKWLLKDMHKGYDIITGYVYSNGMLFGQKYHGIGTNLTIKTEVFKRLGGFEETWGNPLYGNAKFGWRSDTDILWRYLKQGGNKYLHDEKLIVYHPKPFASEFILPIEIEFIKRHKDYVTKYFYNIDPRVVIVNDMFIEGKISNDLINWVKRNPQLVGIMLTSVIQGMVKYNVKPLLDVDDVKKTLSLS